MRFSARLRRSPKTVALVARIEPVARMKRQRNPGITDLPGSHAVPGFHFVPSGLQDAGGTTSTKRSRGAICARVLRTEANGEWPVARMSVSEIRGRPSSSQAAPGFHGACHRAGHFGPDPLVPSGPRKKGRRNAGRRVSPTSAPATFILPACGGGQRRGRGARPAGRARLSAFHRGSCLGDPTPPLSSGYALPGTQPRRVLPALRLSQSSELLADRS